MRFLSLIIICLFLNTISCFAQKDTVYKYFDNNDSVTSIKAFSEYYTKSYMTADGWHAVVFLTAKNLPSVHRVYADTSEKTPVGNWNYYTDSGLLKRRVDYNNGKATRSTFYYENGKRNGEATFDTTGNTITQKGWDENGKEIPGYIFEQEAEFPGGKKGWQQFLERVLRPDVPAKKRSPEGYYRVIASFIVNKDGKLSDITTENDPGYGTKEEVIRVLKKSPL